VTGVVVAFFMNKLIGSFRRKMTDIEQNSEKFKNYKEKTWVRFLSWLLVGSRHKKESYEDLLPRRIGNPIRPLGAVVVIGAVGLCAVVTLFASKPIVTFATQKALERANGATVDLEEADLNMKENKFVITRLAMADPNALDRDLLRAERVEADVSGVSLLTKRIKLDRVLLVDAAHGLQRDKLGKRIGPPPAPVPPSEEDQPFEIPDAKTIDEYITQAKEWKERLAQVKEWIEKVSGPDGEGDESVDGEKTETLRERLEREIREKGYANVAASHLIEGAPAATITELVAQKIRVEQLDGETLDVYGRNLSTHPRLLGLAPEFRVTSSAGTMAFETTMATFAPTPGDNTFNFHFNGLKTDDVAKNIQVSGEQPVSGGTMDISAKGTLSTVGGISVNFPLNVVMHDVTLKLPQLGESHVDQLVLPIQVVGPLDNPGVKVGSKALSDALMAAGVSRAKKEATDRLKKELGGKLGDQLGEGAGEQLGDQGKKLLDGLFGGKKKKDE
jgi:hypothetical protein